MKVELEKHELEYLDNLLHDRYFIYSSKDPIIRVIRDKIETAENDEWNKYLIERITW
jgi:hypothetical protein